VTHFANWPAWASQLTWTIATLAYNWSIGRVLGVAVMSRLAARTAIRQSPWLQTSVHAVRSRIPTWCLLIGVWVAAGYWPLTADARIVVERTVFAIGAFSVTLAAASIASRIVDSYGAVLAPALPVSSLTRNIAWGLIATLGVLVILNGLGLSIAPMLTALGVGGLAVALALQEPLANFFAGVFITLAGQIRVGDYVKLDTGQEGYVVDFSWRSTRLRMLANNLILVPNAKLAQAIVVNHHLPSQDLAVLVDVGVDYGSDLGQVERVVVDVARQTMAEVTGSVTAFEPFVRYHTFADSSINFTVILRGREFVDQYLIKHEFIKRLHARFEHEGIVIPFPIRTIAYRGAARPESDTDPLRPVVEDIRQVLPQCREAPQYRRPRIQHGPRLASDGHRPAIVNIGQPRQRFS
jgi:small-conductance mechanosensitive channel